MSKKTVKAEPQEEKTFRTAEEFTELMYKAAKLGKPQEGDGFVVSRKKMGELEKAVDADPNEPLTLTTMMDAAGHVLLEHFLDCYPKEHCNTVLVLCGKGKNGGDGFIVAKGLVENGYNVVVLLVEGEPAEGTDQHEKLQKLCNSWKGKDSYVLFPQDEQAFAGFWNREELTRVSHVVDAMFGIGFKGELSPAIGRIAEKLKEQDVTVMAVDLPSGMEADRHYADKHLLPADRTITITALKPSLAVADTEEARGVTAVADIGIPHDLVARYGHPYRPIDKELVGSFLPSRHPFAYKGNFGRLLTLCGNYGMAGASILASSAALRSGVGLLYCAVPQSIYPIVSANVWEAVFLPLPETATGSFDVAKSLDTLRGFSQKETDPVTAVLIGCGLSQDPTVEAVLNRWLPEITCPLILDADGLNYLALHKNMVKDLQAPLIITPHEGEAARLLGVKVDEIRSDRLDAVRRLAKEYHAIAVLKGQGTLISSCNDPKIYVNTTGCVGMATGGSGDVLAGMIASLAAQGLNPLKAAIAGVHIHGLAGQEAALTKGERGLLPRDLIDCLPKVLSQFES